MSVDWSSPVMQAIGRGMQAETAGDRAAAGTAYQAAWDAAQDDYERCMAAHYVPRTLDDPHEVLRWNEDALRLAHAVGDDRVKGFFASLNGCVAQSKLALGDRTGAIEYLELASRSLPDVPEGTYKSAVVGMIERLRASAAESGG